MTEKKQRFIPLDEGYDLIIRDTITHTDLCDVDSVVDVLNDYDKENKQLKQDKKRLIGYLHRYGKVDVEDIDDIILNKEYFDEWGDLYD